MPFKFYRLTAPGGSLDFPEASSWLNPALGGLVYVNHSMAPMMYVSMYVVVVKMTLSPRLSILRLA